MYINIVGGRFFLKVILKINSIFSKVILTLISILIIGYLCITLFVNIIFYQVKQAVLEHNPEITSIESIHQVGGLGWGEYVLEIKKETDTTYRIWTYGDGEITYEEIIKK